METRKVAGAVPRARRWGLFAAQCVLCHAMGYNYNGKTRSAELLLRPDGSVVQIRRAETLNDLFATLDLKAVAGFK